MRVYIAGPYSHGDTETNVRAAILVADALAARGHVPYVPHLSHYWHLIAPHDHAFWMRQDREWLILCDGVLRIDGWSDGADEEVTLAKSIGKAIWYDVTGIP